MQPYLNEQCNVVLIQSSLKATSTTTSKFLLYLLHFSQKKNASKIFFRRLQVLRTMTLVWKFSFAVYFIQLYFGIHKHVFIFEIKHPFDSLSRLVNNLTVIPTFDEDNTILSKKEKNTGGNRRVKNHLKDMPTNISTFPFDLKTKKNIVWMHTAYMSVMLYYRHQ